MGLSFLRAPLFVAFQREAKRMVVVGKHFTFLLIVRLVGNPHLTANILIFAPLPTSTKKGQPAFWGCFKEHLYMFDQGWVASGPEEFAKKHPSECECPWRNIGLMAELKKKAWPQTEGVSYFPFLCYPLRCCKGN